VSRDFVDIQISLSDQQADRPFVVDSDAASEFRSCREESCRHADGEFGCPMLSALLREGIFPTLCPGFCIIGHCLCRYREPDQQGQADYQKAFQTSTIHFFRKRFPAAHPAKKIYFVR